MCVCVCGIKSVLIFNLRFTDWVQNVPRCGIFLNNSLWYKVTILPIFLSAVYSPTDTKQPPLAHILLFTYGVYFFQVQLDHFVPTEGALFVQQLGTDKQT